ncbi:MAG: radical SAM protein [Candidatus Hydrothermarchaeales archaeon]
MADLLLVEVDRESKNEERVNVPPLGLAYIAAVCEEAGFSVEIIDLNIQKDLGRVIENASVVGVSFYTHNYDRALSVLDKAKKKKKFVIAGGPHATPLYRDVLADGFDAVVRGEGEYPILKLLTQDGDPSGIKGLAYHENGRTVVKGVWRVKDLDTLPLPARHLLELEKYSFPGALATSRGCSYNCIFCASRNQSGTLRLRSAKSVVEEVLWLRENNMDSFLVIDPNFAYSKRRLLEICDGIMGLGLTWFSELRLDHMDDEVVEAMGNAGCKVVRFGIESGSQRVIDVIKKDLSLENAERTVGKFIENGITPVCGFMIGHPSETKKDFKATIVLAEKIRKLGGEVTFAVQTPYPGTYIHRNAGKLGIDILHQNWSSYHHLEPVMRTRAFGARELREMLETSLDSLGEKTKRRSFRSIAQNRA